MKTLYYYILGFVVVLGIAACSSSKKIAGDASSRQTYSSWIPGESVVARANIALSNGQGKDVSLRGTLRMKRDDVIQLNASYIFGIQVGTLEITKDGVLIVSRTTRQYARFDYRQLSVLLGEQIGFHTMQSVFWGDEDVCSFGETRARVKSYAEVDDTHRLPEKLEISFSRHAAPVCLGLEMSNYKYEDKWNPRTTVNTSTYTQLSPEQVVKIISLLIEEQ